MDVISAERALESVSGGLEPEATGAFADRPFIAVRIDESEATRRFAAIGRNLPCVIVGVADDVPPAGPGEGDFDVLLTGAVDPPRPWVGAIDIEAAVDGLAGAVAASPTSAIVLVQLLRLGTKLSLHDALAAESMAYGLLQSSYRFRAWLEERTPQPHRDTGRPAVLVERDANTMKITFDRPEVRNAFDVATRDGLVAAIQTAVADASIRHVELRGAGPDFCSGGDLTEFGTTPDATTGHLVRTSRSAAGWLDQIAGRATAHLHGACVGAGIELAALCHRVVAAPSTTIALPEVGMGLVPGAGGTATLPRRIGRQRTAWLALSGETVGAYTALRWGLADDIGPASVGA
jgi:enoyl-CoA hydratase/carnithine racemase